MTTSDLQKLLPTTSDILNKILNPKRGFVEPPIRSEIFGLERLSQHGHSLGLTHQVIKSKIFGQRFFPALKNNITVLKEAYEYIGIQAITGYDVSPAGEWLLDNFHIIEGQFKAIHSSFPRNYFNTLPVLSIEPIVGLPRIYNLAWAYIAHTDSAFREDSLSSLMTGYQETCEVNLKEIWALPTILRVVLVENLRRVAERIATHKAAREIANLCCDQIDSISLTRLEAIRSLLALRGVADVFLAQMSRRLENYENHTSSSHIELYRQWIVDAIPNLALFKALQEADQTANNLTVSNSIKSLRFIENADWPSIVCHISVLMRLMLRSPLFALEDPVTRDQTLHAIERLACRSDKSELFVGHALMDSMQGMNATVEIEATAAYWINGKGRTFFLPKLGLKNKISQKLEQRLEHLKLPLYISTLTAAIICLLFLIISKQPIHNLDAKHSVYVSFFIAILAFFPASECVIAVVNRLICESAKPRLLPRLALSGGIRSDQATIVAIPAMLANQFSAAKIVHRLEQHYLANPERHVQFAMLTDWADADTEGIESDEIYLNAARLLIRDMNLVHAINNAEPPRFLLLHRKRVFSDSEQKWIGWERKRGKLEQLVRYLAVQSNFPFIDLHRESEIANDIKYVLTLDSDTQLPPGRLKELIAIAAHPSNIPILDSTQTKVISGYSILQPLITTPIPSEKEKTFFHWLFSGQSGIDTYSAASSEVYQDIFFQGTFTGKGLLNVRAVNAVLAGKLPDEQILSHDLLEGAISRCALVTDVALIEEAPFHADVAASRIHRWMRGDWQLLPLLFGFYKISLNGISKWKIVDNLRRSLVAPASLALILFSFLDFRFSPEAALLLVLTGYTAGPMLGALAGFSPSRDDIAKRHFYKQSFADFFRAIFGGLWHVSLILRQSLLSLDAILRALYRTVISRRNLLQWTTAETAQSNVKTSLLSLLVAHWPVSAIGFSTLIFLLLFPFSTAGTKNIYLIFGAALVWSATPVWIWIASKPKAFFTKTTLSVEDIHYLHGIARDTWSFFERFVVVSDNYLPPDNFQTAPYDLIAHRTSPTNIGLYLSSAACAYKFGWIGTQDFVCRMEQTYAVLMKMQRYKGHFYNWYDTQTLLPLLPKYVSTVDSGNLSGHLIAVSRACLNFALSPSVDLDQKKAVEISKFRIRGLLAKRFDISPDIRKQLKGCLHDHRLMLKSHALDVQIAASPAAYFPKFHMEKLNQLALKFEALAWDADYKFLFNKKRRLFHIGYRHEEQQLDESYYDLLASESRLTSLLAIAKGDVLVEHWAALGRPVFASGTNIGLQSWSGSMFEYLMPSLVLDEAKGSVLYEACLTAVREQIKFGNNKKIPWGISECAYSARDQTLAYQYAPQGVPKLALRRTPPQELVISPYSSVLAAQVLQKAAIKNLQKLELLGARARYGFIEALDYTLSRQTTLANFVRVETFMAHHQGMVIVSIANILLEGAPRTWMMSNSHVESVASLLQQKVPREVSLLDSPSVEVRSLSLSKNSPGFVRTISASSTAVEPTHLLSNGHYSVSLRSNGSGTSKSGLIDFNRRRDDALRDAFGMYFYVRWDQQPNAVSVTHHPAPDPSAHYSSTFHSDRVCFDAAWTELQVHTTVWVSPEDDIELRRLELRNHSDRTLDIELISAFDLALSDPGADEMHPAFSNFFVDAKWNHQNQALIYKRRARLETEKELFAAHFLAVTDTSIVSLRSQTDRSFWLGRNHSPSHPMAYVENASDQIAAAQAYMAINSAGPNAANADIELSTGLDPVSVLAARVRIAPRSKVELTFGMTVSDNAETVLAVIDKYRQKIHIQRASLMSATLSEIRLRGIGVNAENFAAIQTISSLLLLSHTRPHSHTLDLKRGQSEICDRRLLWHFGVSGDRPIVVVTVSAVKDLGLLRALSQALRIWSWGAVSCDLVVINAEPNSYLRTMHLEIAKLHEQFLAYLGNPADPAKAPIGFCTMRIEDLSSAELGTLRNLSRVWLQADGRPLAFHVDELVGLHERALDRRHFVSTVPLTIVPARTMPAKAPVGGFDAKSGDFQFDVNSQLRPAKPWINVLSNNDFGAQFSETGGGCTWAGNSRLNQLTAWSNDPVADTPSEWFLLQDCSTLETWSLSPSAWGDSHTNYRITHGQGFSTVSHQRGALQVTMNLCVDTNLDIKQIQIALVNKGRKSLHLRIVGFVEWMMGSNRAARNTVLTALHRQPASEASVENTNSNITEPFTFTMLLATQLEMLNGFGQGTAFLAMQDVSDEIDDWTCDRREFFDARGRLVLPDHLGQRSGFGLDPCAALSVELKLEANSAAERVFLMGYAPNVLAAKSLAQNSFSISAAGRKRQTVDAWNRILSATTVKTPDPLFDVMVNRWFLYQTVSCRIWAKAGFYQAGGATGFRDQLQDAMAMVWAAPGMLRRQILLCASRQFVQGDVQHWWHAPTGAGVRTHFSDDLLWLPYACLHYFQATADVQILDEKVYFIDGSSIPDGAEDAYYVPVTSDVAASIYEHGALAIEHSLKVGVHGLPLMGSGDWNDGMNRVGYLARGESVWLGWFLCKLVADYATIARQRGDFERSKRWEDAVKSWKTSLQGPAWDGQWFKRAFFDDGTPLGSHANVEARVDLIAQAWSVLSASAPLSMQRMAMEAVEKYLVNHDLGLIKLLDPPLMKSQPSPGYIQAYPPGVRENGGQYSHGAVWALMAQAQLYANTGQAEGINVEKADLAYKYFTYLCSAHRAANPVYGLAYGIEPYVMAGDVYSQPPYVGRGGWSWYTGAAGWMHRAAIESIFGLQMNAQTLCFRPCLPSHWPQAELELAQGEKKMRFVFMRLTAQDAAHRCPELQAKLLLPGQDLNWIELDNKSCFLLPLL